MVKVQRILQKIQQRIAGKDYYISSHAEDEMFDDGLDRADIEYAILMGRIEKRLTRDIRGTRYRIEGPARDGRLVRVICRFKENQNFVIITVYALLEDI